MDPLSIGFGIVFGLLLIAWGFHPRTSTKIRIPRVGWKRVFGPHVFDDSDDLKNRKISGMSVFTDHLTGCEYLAAPPFYVLTPRRTTDGGIVIAPDEQMKEARIAKFLDGIPTTRPQ
tara:strand:- start:3601 stop:3951 length:351 start_codon:yes stop_codon:yes gene_type:complete